MQKILLLLGILAIIAGVALYLSADRFPVEAKNLFGSTITVANPHLQAVGVISGALSVLMIILGLALTEKNETGTIVATPEDIKKDDVNVVKIIIKSFKSIIEDPGYLGIYLLSFSVTFIFYIYLWLNYGSLTPWVGKTSTQVTAMFMSLVIPLVLYVIAYSVIALLTTAAITLKVSAKEKGENISVVACLSEGIRHFPNLFVAGLLSVAIVAGPILLSMLIAVAIPGFWILVALMTVVWIIPMFYICIRLLLFIQACVIDELGPVEGIKSCWRLSKGNFWLIFVTMLLVSVPALILNLIPLAGVLIATLVAGPPSLIASVLLYLEIKKYQTAR